MEVPDSKLDKALEQLNQEFSEYQTLSHSKTDLKTHYNLRKELDCLVYHNKKKQEKLIQLKNQLSELLKTNPQQTDPNTLTQKKLKAAKLEKQNTLNEHETIQLKYMKDNCKKKIVSCT